MATDIAFALGVTFHDAFLEYKNLLNGVLPIELREADARRPAVRQRFIRATTAGYATNLLTFITQQENYESTIDDMTRRLNSVIPKLCKYFDTRQFEVIGTDLETTAGTSSR